MPTLIGWLEAGRRLAERIPYSIVALMARFAVATVFWRSGQTKVEASRTTRSFYFARSTRSRSYRPILPPTWQPSPRMFFRCCSWPGSPRGCRLSASWS